MEGPKTQSRTRRAYRAIYKAIGLVFALLLGLYFLYEIREVVLVFLLTLLFAIVLSGPVNYLARLGLPRGLGILVVLGGFVLTLWLAGMAAIPLIQEQAVQFVRDFPTLLARGQDYVASLQSTLGLQDVANIDSQSILERGRSLFSGSTVADVATVGRSIAEVVSMGVVAFIATIYLVIQPTQVINGFVSLFPARQREKVRSVLGEMYNAVQKWSIGQLSAMVIIGILTGIALSIIGIPYALFIGALSGLLAFIPLLGALVSVVPPVLVALAINPILAVWVVLSYIIIHQIEAHIVQPVVMSRAVTLHPVVVVFAILIMGKLFSLVGLLLAVPLAAALSILVRELWIERMDQIGVDSCTSPPEQEKTTEKGGPIQRALNALRRS
jgi:predicted PurR-regulated permease PerM